MVYLVGCVMVLLLLFRIKNIVWDIPREKIEKLERELIEREKRIDEGIALLNKENEKLKIELEKQKNKPNEELINLKKDMEKLQEIHKEELVRLYNRLQNSQSIFVQQNEFSDIVVFSVWRELSELYNREYAFWEVPDEYIDLVSGNKNPIEAIKRRFRKAVEEQYKYRYLTYIYPKLVNVFDGVDIVGTVTISPKEVAFRRENLFKTISYIKRNPQTMNEIADLRYKSGLFDASKSNLTAIPYMAAIMADYETYGLEHLAQKLDYGHDVQRLKKVKSIREIRKDAKEMVEKYKESQYQLEYLLNLFPNLRDVIDAEFEQLPVIQVSDLADYDCVRDYLTKEEYEALSVTERNQLALDRYKYGRKRTKWQVGRDYELYVGYKYEEKGYDVDYFGSYMGLEDLGRDLIAKKGKDILIIQCKYWSAKKQIHENHINQLYGTMVSYCIENKVDKAHVKGILVTNIELSDMAKKVASYLGIEYIENFERGDYPCIKCNIGRDEDGFETRIYHLPFDQQYDSTKINRRKKEFYASTVAEAEAAGFRRAFKWFGAQ